MTMEPGIARSRHRGFTLIELLIALTVVAILVLIAFPSYQAYIVRSSRQAAQSELVALADSQEKIFLNSSAYSSSVTGNYTGQSGGGLGVAATATTFTFTATPVTGTSQAADGNLTITEAGKRTWGSKTW